MSDDAVQVLKGQVGQSFVSGWMTVDQPLIDRFADVTRDWNFIHVDRDKAVQTPFGGTIAHGFLLLSLLAPLRGECGRPDVPGLRMGLNYGFDRVRFVHPVRSGSRIRAVFTVSAIREKGQDQYLEEMEVKIEIEGADKPAVAACWLTLYMM